MDPAFRSYSLAVLIIFLAFLLSRLSGFIIRGVGSRLIGRTRTSLDDILFEILHSPVQVLIVIGGLDLALAQVESIPAHWEEDIGRAFFLLYALVAYLFLFRLIGGLMTWYGKEIVTKTETELDDRFLDLFRRVAQLALTIVVFIIVLGQFGIEVSALVTTLGIGSLAIALAAQETLGDMITGFTIMIDQPFKVGDRVEIQDIDTWGDVIDIGLRSTRILTRDNRMVSVPNSVIGKGLIVNYSDPSTVYRVQTHVGVAYGSDIEKVRSAMIEAVRSQDWVMPDRDVEALMLEFGDSALVFRVRCWIENYVETRRIIDKMNTVLYKALRKDGIEIPFPQRDLRLLSTVKVDSQSSQNGSREENE